MTKYKLIQKSSNKPQINKFGGNFLKISLISTLLLASACSYFQSADKESSYPKAPKDVRRERAGSLFGDSGLAVFGGKKSQEESTAGSAGIGINSYLWRAALDTLSFMPFTSADPFGGVIITDWYEDSATKGERFKVNLLILSKNLRSDAVKVSVFKQSLKSGVWRDAEVPAGLASDLENKILTRAKELRAKG